ncbi:MAG: aminomethyl-transferring glycine dehydrogenase subunit GcvPA [Pseudomonadales bacterium]|nr:aminomethyl-transferring glycine dehydrogenase subunit GcvPA [Pseudomonadales bacterium]
MPYIPHTDDDIDEMLEVIGVDSIDEIFDEIPSHLRSGELSQVPSGISEMEIVQLMSARALEDSGRLNFIGAGAYEHHIPAAVWEIVTRGEYYTAYTPYQAEASQGTLQTIYEYQSMMAHLTSMDVSNATLYDGASALAEAVLMAIRANKKSKSRKVLMPRSVHPHYRETTRNIVHNQNIESMEVKFLPDSGQVDLAHLAQCEGEDFAALVISQPNFFGVLEDVDTLTDWAHDNGMLVIAVVNPIALALLTPPGAWGNKGADIVVGEGQSLGVPMSSGGPYFGFMCCTQKIVRQMPGRIIGKTVDTEGKTGYALTLQAREQHIRRSKATSNICTNQGLAMSASTVYMSLLGAKGLEQVASHCHHNLMQLKKKVDAIEGVTPVFSGAVFHEMLVQLPAAPSEVLSAMLDEGVIAGLDLSSYYPELGHTLLICVTETKSEANLNRYIQTMVNALSKGKKEGSR